MQLSKNFTLAEMTASAYASEHGINEQFDPPVAVIGSMRKLCEAILQPLRDEIGLISVTSGYRCPKVNSAIGGAVNSQHLKGQAVDIKFSGEGGNRRLFHTIREMGLPYDQLIWEFGNAAQPDWVHVSTSIKPRGQILRATIEGGKKKYISLRYKDIVRKM